MARAASGCFGDDIDPFPVVKYGGPTPPPKEGGALLEGSIWPVYVVFGIFGAFLALEFGSDYLREKRRVK